MADTDILIKDLPLTEAVNDSDDIVTEDSSPTTHRVKSSVFKNYINAEQNEELQGIESDFENVNSNIGSLSSKVDDATTAVSNMQTSINTMDGRVTANADGISELNSALADSGWISLPLTSDFEAYNSEQTPRYRKIGNLVQIVGAVCPTISGTGSTTNIQFATLPSGYRPNQSIIVMCQGSGVCKWCLIIAPNGSVTFGRYSDNNGYAAFTSSIWLPFSVTFFTA